MHSKSSGRFKPRDNKSSLPPKSTLHPNDKATSDEHQETNRAIVAPIGTLKRVYVLLLHSGRDKENPIAASIISSKFDAL
jgi:hypothetical protein